MTNKIFNLESFLGIAGDVHSFDHNDEADFLLSNINSPKHSLNTGLGWMCENPLYKFPNENSHWDNPIDTTNEFLKLLNHNTHELSDREKNDNLAEITKSLEKLKFSEYTTKFPDNIKHNDNCKLGDSIRHSDTMPVLRGVRNVYEERVEGEDYSAYITEGTGTILKIIEASQLWLKHTSSEKIPLKIKKQFTKNDNFV
eukprot:XP_763749.1 hypothetical protein [Theileria parva strain Muguga]